MSDVLSSQLLALKLKSFEQACQKDLATLLPAVRDQFTVMIQKWATTELASRTSSAIASRIKTAKFVKNQTIDQFNFDHSPMTQKVRSNYLNLYDSIQVGQLPSAVFIGLAGLGKTHLARALGYRACQVGSSVLFTTAASMVNHLEQAKRMARLDQALQKYRKPQLLVIDELGYVTMDAQASNLFFQVISARHDQDLGTIATTNLAFGKWNQIFANDAIAQVIVDRLTAEAEVFFMEGESYRPIQREAKKSQRRAAVKASRQLQASTETSESL